VSGDDLRRTAKVMLQILAVQQSRRGEYADTAWLDVEIDVMHHAVNCDRSKRGLADLSRDVIVRTERMASGLADYSSKFALYCAELALGTASWL
jgi:hypothetical protein